MKRRLLGLSLVVGMLACSASSGGPDTPAAAQGGSVSVPRLTAGSQRAPGPSSSTGPVGASNVATAPNNTAGATCANDVTLHGSPGAVIASPALTLLFWGSYWSAAGETERGQYVATWQTVAADPAFYGRLAEYSTPTQAIGSGSWGGSALGDVSLASGTTITEAQIQQEVAAEIAAGTAPAQTANRVYAVMLPPGVTSQFDQQNNFAGHHNQYVAPGKVQPIRYAVITYSTDAGYTDPVVSHEYSEAITDPDLANGWWDQYGNEIGDICRFDYAQLDGYQIETIYSMKSCSCVGAGTSSGNDGGVPNTTTCTAPAWNAATAYTGGTTVSFNGSQYTAAYWNQNDEPDTHNGPATSGQPWLPPSACTTTTCTPSCGGKACGDDGCGGSCGTCGSGQACNASNQCVSACLPSCNLKQCGSDGCGGTCGTCGAGLTCNPNNQCVAPCVPQCNGKQCGGDTCGGSCGTCAGNATCNSDGTCQASASRCAGVPAWDPNQPWYNYAVGEQHTGSNGHLYSCHNVAYCIDDPTSYVGFTYGWTDDGPC